MQSLENTSEPHTLWRELHQICAESIDMAQDVGRRLRAGSAGGQLQPLLEASAAQVGHLREGIRNLARRGEKVDPAERDQLLAQMRILLQLEEQNRTLLSTKGIRLNTPYRYNAARNRR